MFEFVFQSGEFSSENSTLLGIGIDTLFTVFTTIIIFLISNWIISRRKKKDEQEEYEHFRNFFFNVIDSFKESVEKQVEALDNFANSIIKLESKNQTFSSFSFNHFALFENMDSVLLHRSLSQGRGDSDKKLKLYSQLMSKLYFFKSISDSIKSIFKEWQNEFYKNQELYKTSIDRTTTFFDSVITNLEQKNINALNDPFMSKWIEIRNNSLLKENNDPKYSERNYLKKEYLAPLFTLCQQSVGNPTAFTLLQYVKETISLNESFENLMVAYGNSFKRISKNIKETFEKLETIANTMKEELKGNS